MKKTYSKISKIIKKGKSDVLDFTVEDTHRILANNFYTSNCSVRHPDIEEFIDAKIDGTKVTGANISVKIHDDFMKSITGNGKYIQKYPIDSDNPKVIKEVNSKILWNKVVHNAWKSAEPGILFWDKIISESLADRYSDLGYGSVSTNPCGEIPLCPDDSCRLLAINLYSYVDNPYTKEAKFNFDKFKTHARYALRMMDDIIDLEIEKIDDIINKIKNDPEDDETKRVEMNLWKRIQKKCEEGRRTGVGITAEGDMLASMGFRYGTKKATKFATEVHRIYAIEVLRSSNILAKERGTFKVWDSKKEENHPFLDRIKTYDDKLYKSLMKHGRRNIACLTIAPTGCLVENSIVKTNNGDLSLRALFKLNDVDIDDYKGLNNVWIDIKKDISVFDVDGGLHKINKLYWNGMSETTKLKLEGDIEIESTNNHKFLVKLDDKTAVWKRSDDLRIGDKLIKLNK